LTFRHRELSSNYNKSDVKRIETHLDQVCLVFTSCIRSRKAYTNKPIACQEKPSL
jgi:hypothetical protein